MMKDLFWVSVLLLLSITNSWSQQQIDFNLFNGEGELRSIYLQQHQLNDKYSINLDAGSYLGLGNNIWTRWGFRGTIRRKFNDFYSLDFGFMYNRVNYYADNISLDGAIETIDIIRHEYRPHQALHVNYPRFQSSTLKHRLRLEERFFAYDNNNGRDFRMRLRYRILHQGRFDRQPVAPKSFYYRTYAEFNFNIVDEADDVFWIRGRYCIGYGYMFSSKLSADASYFFEHTKPGKDISQVITHIFQFTLRHTINW